MSATTFFLTAEQKQAAALIKRYFKQNISAKMLHDCFELQQAVIKHPSRLKAILASRRFGKTHTALLYLLITALEKRCNNLFAGLTYDSAFEVVQLYFIPILDKYNIKYDLNKTKLRFTFANQSVIRFIGLDSSSKEMHKLRGQNFALCVVDECQHFSSADLRNLVYGVFKPACMDKQGTILMVGTPSDIVEMKTLPLFYAVTTHQEPNYKWQVFRGDTRLNPHMRENFEKEIAELSQNPHWLTSPEYKREYCGEWVIDQSHTVYQFDPIKNIIDALPESEVPYVYKMGLDFGFTDSQAFIIAATTAIDPNLYIVYAYKASGMTLDQVQDKLVELKKQYNFTKIICDHAKQSVETLRARLHWNFVKAEKTEKATKIGMFNNDLHNGTIKLLPGCEELKKEWNTLIWDNDSDIKKEKPGLPNDLADACLYMYRESKHYLTTKPVIKYNIDSAEFMRTAALKAAKRKQQDDEDTSNLTQAEIDFSMEYNYDSE